MLLLLFIAEGSKHNENDNELVFIWIFHAIKYALQYLYALPYMINKFLCEILYEPFIADSIENNVILQDEPQNLLYVVNRSMTKVNEIGISLKEIKMINKSILQIKNISKKLTKFKRIIEGNGKTSKFKKNKIMASLNEIIAYKRISFFDYFKSFFKNLVFSKSCKYRWCSYSPIYNSTYTLHSQSHVKSILFKSKSSNCSINKIVFLFYQNNNLVYSSTYHNINDYLSNEISFDNVIKCNNFKVVIDNSSSSCLFGIKTLL